LLESVAQQRGGYIPAGVEVEPKLVASQMIGTW